MAVDLRALQVAQAVRLLNSAGQGVAVSRGQLYEIKSRAGMRVGPDKALSLVHLMAWCLDEGERKLEEGAGGDLADAYRRRKDAARKRQAEMAREGRDIGPLPPVENPERKEACRLNLRLFCETYFASTFTLGWSPDHLKVIAKAEQAILRGGLFALAMPRGSGKSSLSEVACAWALLYGHRRFVFIIGSDEESAAAMLDSIKVEIETNDILASDFPEVCHPVRKLDGINNRAAGQLLDGVRTRIGWTEKELVLPTVAGSLASGAIARVAGITGRIRGAKFKRPDGSSARPDLVVVDDPQTDESARSLSQCATRERTLAGAVLGLAGPGSAISGVMPCTVIRPGDMADRILNPEIHPEWNGQRCKMVYAFPASKLWEKYAEIRADCLRRAGHIDEATEFYREHRAEMDEGAVVAWPERFKPNELSAIQSAMNLKLQDEEAFWAEYQNEPLPSHQEDLVQLSADDIAAKLNGRKRGIVPNEATRLTSFIDVQESSLWWTLVAWEDDFTGYVVDYGTYPEHPSRYFTMAQIKKTLKMAKPGSGLEGAIYAGLESLTSRILKPWPREDGKEQRVDRCLIDANWGDSTPVVYSFAKQSAHADIITPSHGQYVGAASRPYSDYKPKKGDRIGLNWRMPAPIKRDVRHVLIDTNYWKSFIAARLGVAMGDRGCLSLYGRDMQHHRLLADHCSSEFRVRTEGRGRVVDEWKWKPGRPDNHWWDGLVGAAVAASIAGAAIPESTGPEPHRKRRRVSFAEIRAQRGRAA